MVLIVCLLVACCLYGICAVVNSVRTFHELEKAKVAFQFFSADTATPQAVTVWAIGFADRTLPSVTVFEFI